MYIKGNEFKGILFLKFSNTGMRDNAIHQFLNASTDFHGNRMWMAADKPIEVRVPMQILRNIRKELISWDFSSASLWIDENTSSLYWNGDFIMSTEVKNSSLQLAFGPTWQAFLADSRLKELVLQGNSSLQQSFLSRAKGKGQGKGKGKGKVDDHSVFGLKPEDY